VTREQLTSTVLAPAVVAALVSAVITLMGGWYKAVREDRERRRKMFADAYAAYVAYREFPFVIRRRRADKPADERARIAAEIRKAQQDLGYYIAWTKIESTEVGEAYSRLIAGTRRTAGRAMNRAWAASQPVSSDPQMNITDVGLEGCNGLEDAYLAAVRAHLRFWNAIFTRDPKRIPGASAPDPQYLSQHVSEQGIEHG
jgi:hypothetical protein